ncbi:L-threonylcarbamoyladenylate synthase [Flavobacterium weaverense]|uniref:Threonylcarbamoyl-AMP synthase n=1 Tax=Flavobacterium weaverense TaxID=271156 RepID=A0A3M0A155_9FLAO|nr:L-threonylcarbamoyladenylate synthase [Flavobacterium weaverense]RMA78327.1 translation factor SUA5 [Flavobacterium weaverense]
MIEISTDLFKAKYLLETDELVAIPTETVYGLAGNIYSEVAISKIFETKKRPLYNPLIIHIHDKKILSEVAIEIPEKALKLAEAFWPGSLTLVLKKNKEIPDSVTAGKDTAAFRVPNHKMTLDLLKLLPFPLAAPSANPFGRISPTTAQHVGDYFPTTLAMVLDGGNCQNGIESTIIGFKNEEPILYRLGSISIEEIEMVVGKIKIQNHNGIKPDAPGMLSKHYAPKTKIILVEEVEKELKNHKNKKIGLLLFNNQVLNPLISSTEILSEKGDLKVAMSNLYAAMHRLDKQNLDLIIAEKFPENNLGNSINDRLQRATKN